MSENVYITEFSAKIIDETSIKLIWKGVYNSVSIYKTTNKDNTKLILLENTTKSNYTMTDLIANTVYFFYIIPYDENLNEGIEKNTYITTSYIVNITSFYSGLAGANSIPIYWDGIYYSISLKYKIYDLSDDYITEISPIIGTSFYNIENLEPDTSYNLYITPYDINGVSGETTDILYKKTDYISYIGNIYLNTETISSTTISVSWNGRFSYISLQSSIDNINFETKATVDIFSNEDISYTFISLNPFSTYYFRIVPYDENYNVGIISQTVSNKTLTGFSYFDISYISYNYTELIWDGSYSYVEIYKLQYGELSYNLLNTIVYSSGRNSFTNYTVDDLYNYKTYSFYLLPYHNNVLGVSSEIITLKTDYYSVVSFYFDNSSSYINTLPIKFTFGNSEQPSYTSCKIEISMDNNIFYDVSTIYQAPTVGNPYTYLITSYNDTSGNSVDLISNYTYYVKTTPYNNNKEIGLNPITYYHSTNGYIDNSNIFVYINTDNNIYLLWSGYFSSTYIEYCNDNFTGNYDISSILIYRNEEYSNTTTEIIDLSYTFLNIYSTQTYFFRLKPVNYDGEIGNTTNTFYNANITDIYLSNKTLTSINLNWGGYYKTVSIQSSYDNINFSTIYEKIDTSYVLIENIIPNISIFFKIIPYSSIDISGEISKTVYIPKIIDASLSVIDASNLLFSWSGITDYANLSYSTDDISYSIFKTNAITPGYASFDGMDANNQVYYFKIIPYSNGYSLTNTVYDMSGTISNKIYNAIVNTGYFVYLIGNLIYNKLKITWKGIYSKIQIYYDIENTFSSNNSVYITTSNTGISFASTTISDLSSNTTYYFKLIPYNDNNSCLYYPIISSKTTSLLYNLNFEYDPSYSSASSIRLTWDNNYYSYIKIYNTTGIYYGMFDNTILYIDISGLEANQIYYFYGEIYDNIGNTETTDIITAYTYASTANLNLTYRSTVISGYNYEIFSKKNIFTWDNSGYYSISIRNSSFSNSPTNTFYSKDNITYYDSTSGGEGNLIQNSYYNYIITLKNAYGTSASNILQKTYNTLGVISSFDISINNIETTEIPIKFSGIFKSVVIDISSNSIKGNTYFYNIGNRSNSVYKEYTLNSLNSIINTEANKKYWLSIYPINDTSYVGLSKTIIVKTKSNLSSFYSMGVLDNSSVLLYWDGSYELIVIENATDISFTENYVSTKILNETSPYTYIYNNLQANTKYYFKITSQNQPLLNELNETYISGTTLINDVSCITFGKLTDLYTIDASFSSVSLLYDGSFNSINLYQSIDASNYLFIQNSLNKSTIINNLNSNMKYYYKVIPLNMEDICSNIYSFIETTTLAYIKTYYTTDISINSITVEWDGSYSSIELYKSTDNTNYTLCSGSPFTDNSTIIIDLLPNNVYYFKAAAINSVGISGDYYDDIYGITHATITTFYINTNDISTNSINFICDGSYSSFNIYQSIDGNTYTQSSGSPFINSSVVVSNLLYNKLYYFKAEAINSEEIHSNYYTDINSIYTPGIITSFTTNDISFDYFSFIWEGSFNTIKIYQSINGINYTQSTENYFTENTTIIQDFLPNTVYYFKAAANNSTLYTDILTTKSLAYIGDISAITINNTSVILQLIDGYYDSFKIGYYNTIDNNILYTDIYTYSTDTITISDLLSNTNYYFKAFVYNDISGESNYITTDVSNIITLPIITSSNIDNITDLSSGFIKPTIYGNYTSFKVVYTINNITYTKGYFNYSDTSSVLIEDLSANTTYSYIIYANNRINGSGTDVSYVFTMTTHSNIPIMTIDNSTTQTNNIKLNITTGDYNSIYIRTTTDISMTNIIYTKTISNSDISSVYGNIYIQTDLSENTDYYFNCSSLNSNNVLSNAVSNTIQSTTLGNVYSYNITYDEITKQNIPISWTGTYNTLSIAHSYSETDNYNTFTTITGTENNSIITGNTIITGLSYNSLVYFKLTPYNKLGYAGTSYIINDNSSVTLANISSITQTIYDTSASFIFDGSYSSIKLYNVPQTINKIYNTVNSNIDISGLTANTNYTFYYNAINSIGKYNSTDSSYTIITRPKIFNVEYLDGSRSVIDLSLSGLFSFYKLYYSSNGGILYLGGTSQLTTKNPIITGLNTNTGYIFKIVPYINTTYNGYDYITNTIYTDPSINSITISDTTTDTITLNIL